MGPQGSDAAIGLITKFGELISTDGLTAQAPTSDVDLLILMIYADRGLSAEEIATFNRLRERQIPALILVTNLLPTIQPIPPERLLQGRDKGVEVRGDDRWDFDDLVMLINRVLEPCIAPFLVLHDDDGAPIGLYDLDEGSVIDYSAGVPVRSVADEDLTSLVKEFKDEFDSESFLSDDFTSGLRVIALPYIPERGIGVREVEKFLTTLQQVQL